MKYLLSLAMILVLCGASSATHYSGYRTRVLLVPATPVVQFQSYGVGVGAGGTCGANVNTFGAGAYNAGCGVNTFQGYAPVQAAPVYQQNFGVGYAVGVRNFNSYGSFNTGVRSFQFRQRAFRFNRFGSSTFSFSRTVIR
jgi:hypothetical protein